MAMLAAYDEQYENAGIEAPEPDPFVDFSTADQLLFDDVSDLLWRAHATQATVTWYADKAGVKEHAIQRFAGLLGCEVLDHDSSQMPGGLSRMMHVYLPSGGGPIATLLWRK